MARKTRAGSASKAGPAPRTPPPLRQAPLVKVGVKAGRGVGVMAVLWWRLRIQLLPLNAGIALFAAAFALDGAPGGPHALVLAAAVPLVVLALWWHQELRRRRKRPLNQPQKIYVRTCAAASWLYLTASAVLGALTVPLLVVFGCGTLAALLCWWLRGHVAGEQAPSEPAPEELAEAPADLAADAVESEPTPSEIWAAGIASSALPKTRLIDVEPLIDPDGNPNGIRGLVELNAKGAPVVHTAASLGRVLDKVGVAFEKDPGNIALEPSRSRLVPIMLFERHPLMGKKMWPGPAEHGFRHPLGPDVTNRLVEHDLWLPDHGAPHGMVIGTTGSGKSFALRTLLAMERHTRDEDGNPLVASWLLDPHKGVSFPGWRDHVDVFCFTAEEIRAAVQVLLAEMARRLDLMAEQGVEMWIPTAEAPLISLTFDEAPGPLSSDPLLGVMLAKLVRECRKAGISVRLGTQYPRTDLLGNDSSIKAALLKYVLLLKTTETQTAWMAAGTRDVGDPMLIPEMFEDGSSAGGVGFYLGGLARGSVMMRVGLTDKSWQETGETVRTGMAKAVQLLAEEYAGQAAEGKSLHAQLVGVGAAAGEMARTGFAPVPGQRSHLSMVPPPGGFGPDGEQDGAAGLAAGTNTWDLIEHILSFRGQATTGEIITALLATGVRVNANTVSQCCSRARDRGLVEGDGHRGWMLTSLTASSSS